MPGYEPSTTTTPGRLRAVRRALLLGAAALGLGAWIAGARPAATETQPYHSPLDVAYAPSGKLLAASDTTAGSLAVLDAASGRVLRRVVLAKPGGLAWASASRVWVAESGGRSVAEVDAASGKLLRRFAVDPRPAGVALAPKKGLLLVTQPDTNKVAILGLNDGKARATLAIAGQPYWAAVGPDESLAVITSLITDQPGDDPGSSATVSLVDLATLKRAAAIRLPAGSTSVREAVVSPDGRWAYVAHVLGRFNVPTTQLERGWVNTNALSILDLRAKALYATLLLDHPHEGAADPWATVLSKDGKTLWISLAGPHQVARIDLARLHPLLEGKSSEVPDNPSEEYRISTQSVWFEVKRDPKQRAELVNDLAALHSLDLIEKTPLPGKGPRGMDLAPDGSRLAIAAYFAGSIYLAEPMTGKVAATFPLGPQRKPDAVRQGEIHFHDATLCFQHWLSCSSCHPDGRADGLNWDLLNDGMGNPKNTKSLLLAYKTPPVMSHGVRPDMEHAVAAGFRFIQFHEPTPDEVKAISAYLRAMRPETSPYRLPSGKLSPQAARGKAIFESATTRCATCHPAPLYTDLRTYNVGTRSELDSEDEFDTPTLVEVWRTPPYLHDGSAPTVRDVLTKRNKGDRHGKTSHLTKQQLDDLAAYVLSLP